MALTPGKHPPSEGSEEEDDGFDPQPVDMSDNENQAENQKNEPSPVSHGRSPAFSPNLKEDQDDEITKDELHGETVPQVHHGLDESKGQRHTSSTPVEQNEEDQINGIKEVNGAAEQEDEDEDHDQDEEADEEDEEEDDEDDEEAVLVWRLMAFHKPAAI